MEVVITTPGLDVFLEWLESNNAALITDVALFVGGYTEHTLHEWIRVCDELAARTTNIQKLDITWEKRAAAEHVGFVRALSRIKVEDSLVIGGMYLRSGRSF